MVKRFYLQVLLTRRIRARLDLNVIDQAMILDEVRRNFKVDFGFKNHKILEIKMTKEVRKLS